jgi:small subunit ribosomal protein S9
MADTIYVGRRKTSVARVALRPGEGKFNINGRALEDYFPQASAHDAVRMPFVATETVAKYDVKANIRGGGFTGQADALKLAIARALVGIDGENRAKLKTDDLLSRDPRMVERKKYGRPKARKRFQFSKR